MAGWDLSEDEDEWVASLAEAAIRIEIRTYSPGQWTLAVEFPDGKYQMRASAFPGKGAAKVAALDMALSLLGEEHRDKILKLKRAPLTSPGGWGLRQSSRAAAAVR